MTLEYVCRSMRKSEIMNEMKMSGVAMKREKKDSVAALDPDIEPSFDVGFVVVAAWDKRTAGYGQNASVVRCRAIPLSC